jgi:hypothetical protein
MVGAVTVVDGTPVFGNDVEVPVVGAPLMLVVDERGVVLDWVVGSVVLDWVVGRVVLDWVVRGVVLDWVVGSVVRAWVVVAGGLPHLYTV